jgi:hypothetical protein
MSRPHRFNVNSERQSKITPRPDAACPVGEQAEVTTIIDLQLPFRYAPATSTCRAARSFVAAIAQCSRSEVV